MNLKKIKNLISNNSILIFNRVRVLKFLRSFYKEQHQITSTTSADRYPPLFIEVSEVSRRSGQIQDAVLLSFGCSTGEECFTLRKYFPKAKIIGADIRKSNLRRAIKNKKDDRTHFIFSNPDNIKLNGPYDIIFCLSVLCRWNDTEFVNNCKEIYPFTKFDETISMMAII